MTVNINTLMARIDNLMMLKNNGVISLEGDYKLEAYKMLLARLEAENLKSNDSKERSE